MNTGRVLLAVAVTFILIATSPIAAGESNGAPAAPTVDVVPPPPAPGDVPPTPTAADKGMVNVIVVTSDISELTDYVARLTGVPVRTPRPKGFATPLLSLPQGMIDEVRKLPSTVGVFDYAPAVKSSVEDPEALSGAALGPTNWNATIDHKAPAAWARNITGAGVNIAIPDDTGLTRHVGDQRSRGVELELTADLAEGWNAFGAYAFSDAVLTRFAERVLVGFVPPTYATVDRSGNAPAFAPRHILNLWLSRKLGWGLGVGAGARYVGKQYIAEDNAFEIDDYWLLNAALSYQRKGWRWSVNLENLTDREYQTRGFAGSSVIPGNPFAAYAKLELSLGSR